MRLFDSLLIPQHPPATKEELSAARQPLHLRMPFLTAPLALGDAVHGVTQRLGIPECSPCQKRRQALNQAMQFDPWKT